MGTSRAFRATLPHTCDIETWTSAADDGFGQPIKVWAALAADVKCRLRTLETGRPWEVFSPTRGEAIAAEFQVFFGLTSSTWLTNAPTFDEQARLVFSSSPYGALTLNVELVAVRTNARADHHIECYANRSVENISHLLLDKLSALAIMGYDMNWSTEWWCITIEAITEEDVELLRELNARLSRRADTSYDNGILEAEGEYSDHFKLVFQR